MASAAAEASKTPPQQQGFGRIASAARRARDCIDGAVCATVPRRPMDSNPTMPLQTHLPRPARGGSTRVQFGNKEVVLESTRGGYSLLWLDGREARRLAIGLAADGTLRLALRAPRLPVRVAVRDTVTLAPRSRLRGYVQVPLVPTILWHDDNSEPQLLAEFPRADLAAEWDDREGTFYRCVSPLHVRYPIPGAEPRATVPVWLRNETDKVASPAYLPLQLLDEELCEFRGGVAVPPRRLGWNGQTFQPLARRRAEVAL